MGCAEYLDVLNRIRRLLQNDRAEGDLRRYLVDFSGAMFDKLADLDTPNEFTDRDFAAVHELNVEVLHSARSWFRGPGMEETRLLLEGIPADKDIWEIEPAEYDSVLGPESPAWRLWELIRNKQAGAGHAGTGVTAGKLMNAKRPRLIPIYDRGGIGQVLKAPHGQFWRVIWCALRDPEIRQSVRDLQGRVSEAEGLSVVRVLDIVIWMSAQPPLT